MNPEQIAEETIKCVNDLIAAFIFENNLSIAPQLLHKDVYVAAGKETYWWIEHNPDGKPIPPEFEKEINQGAVRFRERAKMYAAATVMKLFVGTERAGWDTSSIVRISYMKRSEADEDMLNSTNSWPQDRPSDFV